jgi:hypothetical protein
MINQPLVKELTGQKLHWFKFFVLVNDGPYVLDYAVSFRFSCSVRTKKCRLCRTETFWTHAKNVGSSRIFRTSKSKDFPWILDRSSYRRTQILNFYFAWTKTCLLFICRFRQGLSFSGASRNRLSRENKLVYWEDKVPHTLRFHENNWCADRTKSSAMNGDVSCQTEAGGSFPI